MLLYTNRDKIKSDAYRNRFCEIVFDGGLVLDNITINIVSNRRF